MDNDSFGWIFWGNNVGCENIMWPSFSCPIMTLKPPLLAYLKRDNHDSGWKYRGYTQILKRTYMFMHRSVGIDYAQILRCLHELMGVLLKVVIHTVGGHSFLDLWAKGGLRKTWSSLYSFSSKFWEDHNGVVYFFWWLIENINGFINPLL